MKRSKPTWRSTTADLDESVARALAAVREKYGDRLASVIHLAAHYDFSGKPSPLYRTLTVEGTRRLLNQLQKFQVEQVVFSSTLFVMKPVEEDEVITEWSATESEDEMWDYPHSKIEAERVIRKERGKIPAVILRIAGAYDEDCHSIPIAQQIARIYERRLESYFFPGDADHGQAFIHLNDLVDSFQRAVELRQELGPSEIFLIAEPDVMSYAELQDSLGDLIHGVEWPAIRIPKAVAKAGAWMREKIAGEEETFICLVTAVISLVLIALAYDEVWSSLLYLHRVWRQHAAPRCSGIHFGVARLARLKSWRWLERRSGNVGASHRGNAGVALWLIGFGYLAAPYPTPPALQNGIL